MAHQGPQGDGRDKTKACSGRAAGSGGGVAAGRSLAALGLALALPTAGAAAPANAEWVDEPHFSASSVSVDKRQVTVTGFDMASVTVTVSGGFSGARDGRDLWLEVQRPANPRSYPFRQDLRLALVSGNQTRGTWRGTLRFPSTAGGTWTLSHVYPWEDCYGDSVGVDCKGTAVDWGTVKVTGTHVPKLSAWVRPKPLPVSRSTYEVRGQVLDSTTNKPFRSQAPVALFFDTECDTQDVGDARFRATTRPDGGFTIPVRNSLTSSIDGINPVPYPKAYLHCVMLGRPGAAKPGIVDYVHVGLVVQPSVSAKPVATSVRVGRTVRVDGRAQDIHQSVVLQRKVGRTKWRTVGTAPLRASGRFTLYAQPPAKGTHYYRAAQLGRNDPSLSVRSAASKTFTIVAR